jgi:hypothetical protein
VSVVSVVLDVPDRSTVPAAVPVAAVLLDGVLDGAAVSLELPCMDPQAARGRIKMAETMEKEQALFTRCLANALVWSIARRNTGRRVSEANVTYVPARVESFGTAQMDKAKTP